MLESLQTFMTDYGWNILALIGFSLLMLVVLLVIIAFLLILADRKIWAAVQMRRGPNVVGPWGLLQSFADFIKFALKEPVIPDTANKGIFLFAPFIMATLSIAAWAVIPVNDGGWVVGDINVGILYIFAQSRRSASTASSWVAGRRTRNIPFMGACVRPRRWCPTKFRSAS